jgi:cell division protease FtsH
MSEDNQGNRQDGPGRKGQDPQFNWRGFLFFGVTLALVVSALMINTSAQRSTRISYQEFRKYVKEGQVDPNKPLELVQQDTSMEQFIRGWRLIERNATPVTEAATGGTPAAAAEPIPFTVSVNVDLQKDELNTMLTEAELVLSPKYENNMLSSMLIPLIPLALVLGLIYFLVRQQIRTAGRGALGFGKSKAKMLAQDRNKVTFKDVAGCDEAKEEVQELVEFLVSRARSFIFTTGSPPALAAATLEALRVVEESARTIRRRLAQAAWWVHWQAARRCA